ncbi:hypothetical protein [Marinoscillum furvescens]|uniref:Uncharacterized protein n=1 Tax=Marinoscillum furvescens DSM 4134 TaxID=1122208 RepID=A0A3D9L1W6_MARFU|nr:hypothetical protein [Marinoscillum furvescens]RED96213.1 hypothetical protein C7460_115104 [Marinoscillum furvescens DSM 4134]
MNTNDLHNAPKKLPFEVPDGYFEQLEKQIHERVAEPESMVKWLSVRWAAVPAFVLLLATTVWITYQKTPQQNAATIIAEVPTNEVIAYLETMELTDEEIASLSRTPEKLLHATPHLEEMELPEEDLDFLLELYDMKETI